MESRYHWDFASSEYVHQTLWTVDAVHTRNSRLYRPEIGKRWGLCFSFSSHFVLEASIHSSDWFSWWKVNSSLSVDWPISNAWLSENFLRSDIDNSLVTGIIVTVSLVLMWQELADAYFPFVEHAIQSFGPDRCMWASNFPPDGIEFPGGMPYDRNFHAYRICVEERLGLSQVRFTSFLSALSCWRLSCEVHWRTTLNFHVMDYALWVSTVPLHCHISPLWHTTHDCYLVVQNFVESLPF